MSESRHAATALANAQESEVVGTWAPMGWEPLDPGFGDDPFGSVLGDPLMGSPLLDGDAAAAAAAAPGRGDPLPAADGGPGESNPVAQALAAQQAQQVEELRAAARRYLDQAASPHSVGRPAAAPAERSGAARPVRAAGRPAGPPVRGGLPPEPAAPYGVHGAHGAVRRGAVSASGPALARAAQRGMPAQAGSRGAAPAMRPPRGAATPGVASGGRPRPHPARVAGRPAPKGGDAQSKGSTSAIGFIIMLVLIILSILR